MFTLFALYIALSLIIGYFGRRRKMEFWGLLFGSMLLTPPVGLVLLLVTDDVPDGPSSTARK